MDSVNTPHRRMQALHAYGPDVDQRGIIDALRTTSDAGRCNLGISAGLYMEQHQGLPLLRHNPPPSRDVVFVVGILIVGY